MRFLFYFLTFVPLCTATNLAFASTFTSLDFDAARDIAHERVDAIRVEKHETARRQYATESIRSMHGPKVTLDAKQVWGSKEQNNLEEYANISGIEQLPPSLGPILANLPPIHINYKDDIDGPRVALQVKLPIYTGGAITNAVKASQASVVESQSNTAVKINEIDTVLAQRYFAVQLTRSVKHLHAAMLEQQEALLKQAKAYEKEGTISRLERMAVEVNRDTAKREYEKASNDAHIMERQLAGLLREKDIGPLASPLFVVKSNLGSLEDWKSRARLSSPVLQAIDAQRLQAAYGVKVAQSAWHPQVYAYAQNNLVRHYLTLTEPDWIAGIGVRITLWDNKDRSARVHEARSLIDKANAGYQEALNQIETAIETAYFKSQDARDQYELTASMVELAKENYQMRTKSFGEGLSTANEVNEARTKLLAAEVARRAAAFDFVLAWSALHGIASNMDDFVASMSYSDNVFEP